MKKNNILMGFTLIEILVAIGVLGVLMLTTVGVMTMSFKAKNSTESNEKMSTRAVFILGEIKNNILNAQNDTFNCPSPGSGIGTSIYFQTKDGGITTLVCNETTGQIASVSASGNYNYLDGNVIAINCDHFVRCNLSGESDVISIGFSLNLAIGDTSKVGSTGIFHETVTPRD